MSATNGAKTGSAEVALDPEVSRRILDAIRSLQFGAVEVTVHDGRVVQIDRRERTRLSAGREERNER
jgi:hypothetical protein